MGATSVTGVGLGGVDHQGGGNKGSEHQSLAVHRLIGPRVVACGDVDLNSSGYATVYFPPLAGGADLYCPFLSSSSATFPYWGVFTSSSFYITGGASAHVCWQLVKQGLWGSPTVPSENNT